MLQRVIRGPTGSGLSNRGARRAGVKCGATYAKGPVKRALVTGGNQGIGYQVALNLARQNFDVTIAARNDNKSADAKAHIEAEVPGAVVRTQHLDLSDFSSVREAADELLEQDEPFDVVVNNAGVFAEKRCITKDGIEQSFQVHFLGHYLLTSLLLPTLLASGKSVRIVNVASAVHTIGLINWDDINSNDKDYNGWLAYGAAKLAVVMWTYQLAKRLEGSNVTVNASHPGVAETALGRNFISHPFEAPFGKDLGQKLGNLISDTPAILKPEDACHPHVHLATSPDVEGKSGQYWANARPFAVPQHQLSAIQSLIPGDQERVIQLAEKLTGEPIISNRQPAKAKQSANVQA